MSILKLAWKNLWIKPLNTVLTLLLFALGVGLMTLLILINAQIKDQLDNNLADIDLVIGAKGSPLQLILCNMYHIDAPTGNVEIKDVKAFLNPKHPLIKKSVPVSVGDSYKNHRIVGTTHEFPSLYKGSLSSGNLWKKDFEVCIGREVMDETGLALGSEFESVHGFDDRNDLTHDHQTKFKVVGIFEETGSVLDRLILTNTSTVWNVHNHDSSESEIEEEGQHEDHEGHDHSAHDHSGHAHDEESGTFLNEDLILHEEEEITALLIQYKYRNNFQALNMPRSINENNNKLQAASPAYEISRVYAMLGSGTEALRILAIVIAIVSALSIFFSLYSSLDDRKYELSMMRVLGASRSKIFLLIIFEGIALAILGFLLGSILGHFFTDSFAGRFSSQFKYGMSGWIWHPLEWFILIGSLIIGFFAAIIPAWRAYRMSIHDTLSSQ